MYNSTIWHLNKTHIKLLEGVQKRATKYILNDYESDYKTRLRKCNLFPLSYYKELRDLYLFFKCLNGFFDIDVNTIFTFSVSRNTRTRQSNDPLRLILPAFKTEKRAAFYSVRLVKLWNSLPLHIRSMKCNTKGITSFKKGVMDIYRGNFENKFDPANPCTWVTYCRCPLCREA